jgi:hypothetical protein
MVIGEQGLAALALGTFAEVYEIEGDCPIEVASGLGWDPLEVDFRPICGQFEVDPGWISALDFWCRF